ncbi:MAG: hypothetical protein IKV35_04310, partial [Clostridia bacterium]|nr:hypothetical protein [Clostridia bacterium]
GVIEQNGECLLVTIGSSTMLMCSRSCDAATLPEDWCDVTILSVETGMPEGAERLAADETVVFCGYSRIETVEETVPRRLTSLYMMGRDGNPIFTTRGNGDISLRSY